MQNILGIIKIIKIHFASKSLQQIHHFDSFVNKPRVAAALWTPCATSYYEDKALFVYDSRGLLISILRCVNALMAAGNVTRLTILLTNCPKLYYILMTGGVIARLLRFVVLEDNDRCSNYWARWNAEDVSNWIVPAVMQEAGCDSAQRNINAWDYFVITLLCSNLRRFCLKVVAKNV